MGMHVGMIAAKVPVHCLRDEFLRLNPEFELAASAENLPNREAAIDWQTAHDQFVSAADWTPSNPGTSVYIFWEDGPWALMDDPSYVHSADKEKLAALSASLGLVLSLVVESVSGCAMFGCFQDGRLRRWISYSDGESTLTGEPLPEEAGINVSQFYMDEAEAIWKAFDLNTFADVDNSDKWQAICVIDRTDYTELLAKPKQQAAPESPKNSQVAAPPREIRPPSQTPAPTGRTSAQTKLVSKRPWWKFW